MFLFSLARNILIQIWCKDRDKQIETETQETNQSNLDRIVTFYIVISCNKVLWFNALFLSFHVRIKFGYHACSIIDSYILHISRFIRVEWKPKWNRKSKIDIPLKESNEWERDRDPKPNQDSTSNSPTKTYEWNTTKPTFEQL